MLLKLQGASEGHISSPSPSLSPFVFASWLSLTRWDQGFWTWESSKRAFASGQRKKRRIDVTRSPLYPVH